MQVQVWIVPWYREEDWAQWCSHCDLKGSYDGWVARTEAFAKQKDGLGYNVAKILIEPAQFLEWSRVHGRKTDHEARVAYAISIFRARPIN